MAHEKEFAEQMNSPVTEGGKQLPPLPVENLAQFAQLMNDWFSDCQAQIDAAKSVPSDVRIRATIQGKERVLNAREREAFMRGVEVAGEIFKSLPFQTVEAPAEEGEANG